MVPPPAFVLIIQPPQLHFVLGQKTLWENVRPGFVQKAPPGFTKPHDRFDIVAIPEGFYFPGA
jgi:hypothetical protein